jgi:hypothetical protein
VSDPNWKIADEFDRRLFALHEKAVDAAGVLRTPDEKRWSDAAHHLRQARAVVRTMTRQQDREQTS